MTDELITQFSSTSFSEWCREKFDRFTADLHAAPDAGDFVQAEFVGYVQTLPDGETNRPLLVMAVHAGDQINERSSRRKQFDFARQQLQSAIDTPPSKVKGLFTQGLFAFYDNSGAFRLSLVTGRAEGKKLVYSDFRRQSFFVKPDRNNKTFRARMELPFGTYQELANVFSVETLTKEFYNCLFSWFERAMDPKSRVTFPNDLARDDDDRHLLPEHLIRLITRLMFVWFLRQKDLVPETLFDGTELEKLLKGFDPESRTQDNYYRAILQNLFFATLNCEIRDRAFAGERGGEDNKEHYGIKVLYRYRDEFACTPEAVLKLFRRVPFLNGGLFECLDKKRDDSARSPVLYHDGFSREPKKRAHLPNNLFLDDAGLITLFERYDFTVDENSPNDSDVALDPELLGKVFENLLGAYNPETQETARKQSGSFYTPREIVNYMVEETLVAHLRSSVPNAEEPVIRLLLGDETPPEMPESLRRSLVAALYHCRILDPACGSGAFPMGLLLKMVHLLQRLDQNNTLWHEVVLADTEKALTEAETLSATEKRLRRQRITDSFDQDVNHPDYARKLYLIENCIFGVDIQPIAVQIAKLRAFITLVCDQEPDKENVAGNYGMLPLPNLETKFVAANSLIGLTCDFADGLRTAEGDSRLDDDVLKKLRIELAEVRHQHFRARNAHDKNDCRKQDRELRGKIKTRLVEIASKPDATKIARFQVEMESLQLRRKAVEHEDWRDVVHTKPTQPDMFQSTPVSVQTVMRTDVNKEQRDRLEVEIRFVSRAIETEQNRAKNKSAFQKEADRLAAWDPYDQNTSSPFFDPQWMFGFKGGFDIVIGNPPWVSLSGKHGIEDNLNAKDNYIAIYDGNTYMPNLYEFFLQRGLRLLRNAGLLVFILPDRFAFNESFVKLRRQVLSDNAILQIVYKWKFESVIADTMTLLIQRGKSNIDEVLIKSRPDESFLSVSKKQISETEDCVFKGFKNIATKLLIEKVQRLSKPLRTYAKSTSGFGGKSALITTERVNKRQIPVLKGASIQRYCILRELFFEFKPENLSGRTRDTQKLGLNEKVLLRKTGDRLIASFDDSGRYPEQSLYFLHDISPEVDQKCLLALLNSSLLTWYYLNYLVTNLDSTPQLKNCDLDIMPIIVPKDPVPLVSLVNRILASKHKNPAADTTELEREIDYHVYGLYCLLPEEISIIAGGEGDAKSSPSVTKPSKTVVITKKFRKSVMKDDPELA